MRKADIESITAALVSDAGAFWAGVTKFQKVILAAGGEVMDGHHRIIASVLAGEPIPEGHIYWLALDNQRPVYGWIDVLPH